MEEPRCPHELLLGQCAACAAPDPGLPVQVVVTRGGSVFHRSGSCGGLVEGQRRAEVAERTTHVPKVVSVLDARAEGRGACEVCFPHYAPQVQRPKPCWILRGDERVPGTLLEWRRKQAGGWEGVVATEESGEWVSRVIPADQLAQRDIAD